MKRRTVYIITVAFACCFAIAAALKEEASLATVDPEFKKVQKIVKID